MTIKKKTWSSLRSLHFYYLPNIERMDASSLLHLKIKRNCACLRLKCSLLHSVLKIKTKNKLIISKKQRSKSIQNQSMSWITNHWISSIDLEQIEDNKSTSSTKNSYLFYSLNTLMNQNFQKHSGQVVFSVWWSVISK